MKFSDRVTVRIRNEADYAGFSDNAACLALHSLTAEDLVEALRDDEEPLAIAYKSGLIRAAEMADPDCCGPCSNQAHNALRKLSAAIRAEASK